MRKYRGYALFIAASLPDAGKDTRVPRAAEGIRENMGRESMRKKPTYRTGEGAGYRSQSLSANARGVSEKQGEGY